MDVDPAPIETEQMQLLIEGWRRSHAPTIYYCLPSALNLPMRPATADTHVLFIDLYHRLEAEYDAERFLVKDAYALPVHECPPVAQRLARYRKGSSVPVAMAVLHCAGAYNYSTYEVGKLPLWKGVNEGWREHLLAFTSQGIRKTVGK